MKLGLAMAALFLLFQIGTAGLVGETVAQVDGRLWAKIAAAVSGAGC